MTIVVVFVMRSWISRHNVSVLSLYIVVVVQLAINYSGNNSCIECNNVGEQSAAYPRHVDKEACG